MPDIFVSYAREDFEKARALAKALEAKGWSVFWDRDIPASETSHSFTGKALEESRCLIVAWSAASINSEWVHDEAEEAKQTRTLIPVFFDEILPPLGFRSIQAEDLSNWDGDESHDSFSRLHTALTHLLGAPNGDASPNPSKMKGVATPPIEPVVDTPKPTSRRKYWVGIGLVAFFVASIGIVIAPAFVARPDETPTSISNPVTAESMLGSYNCIAPGLPTVPDGSTASEEQMLSTQNAVEAFQASNASHRECINAWEPSESAELDLDKLSADEEVVMGFLLEEHNSAVTAEEDLAALYNEELAKYQVASP